MGRHKINKISPIKQHFYDDLIPFHENYLRHFYRSDVNGTTYWYKNKCLGRNVPLQQLHVPYKKISRKFIYDITEKYSNKGTLGLCAYLALKSHAVSSTKYYKGKGTPKNAWVSGSKTFFEKITGDNNFFQTKFKRKEKYCAFKNILLSTSLICNLSEIDSSGRIYFSFPEQTTKGDISNNSLKAEFAAINSHNGYVFSRYDINDLWHSGYYDIKEDEDIDKSVSVSECDALCDLWMNTVYNDENYSFTSGVPIVLFSETYTHTGMDMLNGVCTLNSHESLSKYKVLGDKNTEICSATMRQLSKRWNMSLGKVHKLLDKFKKDGFIDYIAVPNRGLTIIMKCFSEYLWNIKYEPVSVYDIFSKYFPETHNEVYKNYISKKVTSLIKKMRSEKHTQKISEFVERKWKNLSDNSYFLVKNLRSFSEKIFSDFRSRKHSVYRHLRGSPPVLQT